MDPEKKALLDDDPLDDDGDGDNVLDEEDVLDDDDDDDEEEEEEPDGEEYADDFAKASTASKPGETSLCYAADWERPATPTNKNDDESHDHQSEDPPEPRASPSADVEAIRKERDDLAAELEVCRKRETERRAARRQQSVAQLHDELFEASSKLVAEAEKNAALSRKLVDVKAQNERLRGDANAARAALMDRVSSRSGRDDAYKHVTLAQLVALRDKAVELAADRPGTATALSRQIPRPATVPTTEDVAMRTVANLEDENARLRAKLRRADEDKHNLRAQLKAALGASDDVRVLKQKLAEMLHRCKHEKDLRTKAEDDAKLGARKVSALSDHVEKLMVHLKHEVGAKLTAQDQLRKAEKEIEAARQRNTALLKRNNAREKFLLELKEGSKILEDQLRLMDKRYLELRAKLDWTRHNAERQVKKAKATASTLRAKWAALNPQNALLDNVPRPSTRHDPLAAAAGDDLKKHARFVTFPAAATATAR